jgi:pimeloyl-ACP methyl ester carboxylesterase
MATQLNGSNQFIALGGGYALRTPGLRGEATLAPPESMATRAATGVPDDGFASLDRALRSENVTEVKLIDLSLQPGPARADAAPLRGSQGEPQVELEIPDLGPEVGQIVVSIDDAGAVRWHLPDDRANGPGVASTRSAGATRRFRIPATLVIQATDAPGAAPRSIFGAVARRVLKVLVYPITDPLIGAISEHFAERWEAKKRPHGLRSFSPGNFSAPGAHLLTPAELESMRTGGPVLMFIHGTFSTAHGGFGELPVETVRELHRRYGGRVVALDHPTLASTPVDNVQWLLAQLPVATMQMDIVCHSRGGLVARVLAERLAALGPTASRVDVRRIAFVGVPNSGTALADPDHMVDMIDRLTTVLTLSPTGAVTETLEALITAIKTLAHGALKGLGGLASMNPGGPFLRTLNMPSPPGVDYFAVASNYEPVDRGLRGLVSGAADGVLDRVFANAGNDLVVPTDGVTGGNGGTGFPLADANVLTFPPQAGVMHTGFFRRAEVSERLLAWMT